MTKLGPLDCKNVLAAGIGFVCLNAVIYPEKSVDGDITDRPSGQTTYGRECVGDDPAAADYRRRNRNQRGKHEHSYHWCYTECGWDYCCPDKDATSVSKTTYGVDCHRTCDWDGMDYKWCYTDSSDTWDYCCHQGPGTSDLTQACVDSNCDTCHVQNAHTCYKCRAGYGVSGSGTCEEYERLTSGSCSNNIISSSACADAAASLGLSDTTATDDGQSGVSYDPPYCYYESGSLKYNSNGQNTGGCTSSDNCLCVQESWPIIHSGAYCSSGYYTGNPTPGATLSSCKKLCADEPACVYFAYKPNTCSRYNSNAGSCHAAGSGHVTYKKPEALYHNCPAAVGLGWKLVRRTPNNLNQASDMLVGTDEYGTVTADPLGTSAFSIPFETAVPGWNQILLSTGTCNHWMVMTKEVAIGSWYSNEDREVLMSHTSTTPYNVKAYRRQTNAEDPWLQYGASHDQCTALYYGNNFNACSGNGEGAQNQGLNVYVRQATTQ